MAAPRSSPTSALSVKGQRAALRQKSISSSDGGEPGEGAGIQLGGRERGERGGEPGDGGEGERDGEGEGGGAGVGFH